MPECGAAVSGHGHGRLGEPKGFAAVSLLAHENRWRNELWFSLSPSHGPWTSIFGRRKVNEYLSLSSVKRSHE